MGDLGRAVVQDDQAPGGEASGPRRPRPISSGARRVQVGPGDGAAGEPAIAVATVMLRITLRASTCCSAAGPRKYGVGAGLDGRRLRPPGRSRGWSAGYLPGSPR